MLRQLLAGIVSASSGGASGKFAPTAGIDRCCRKTVVNEVSGVCETDHLSLRLFP